MLCTQEGAAKGHKGKALEAFVDKCLKARQDADRNGDALPPAEAVNC